MNNCLIVPSVCFKFSEPTANLSKIQMPLVWRENGTEVAVTRTKPPGH